ncbi:probable aldo-keto reductase 1 [Rosa rugosa]|uniref:probable aldo-keto reductase 1 n=1 Tax=Rosa rugosa TaxID=74645 RepID=UPI002B41782A|nr:probable aldo-keto reductase 1 [Rosa rugosa]
MGTRARALARSTKDRRSWTTVRPFCLTIDSASEASISNLGESIFEERWCFGSTWILVIGIKLRIREMWRKIPKVQLGSQGLEVSRLGFGCGGLSGIYKAPPLSHEAGCSVIKEAFNRGITFFDTSDLYGHNHDNEIMVGKALKQLPREKVQLATKFGIFKSDDFQLGINGSSEYVRACYEASLKRLDVDYIDLYYQHRVDVSVAIEDTVRAKGGNACKFNFWSCRSERERGIWRREGCEREGFLFVLFLS